MEGTPLCQSSEGGTHILLIVGGPILQVKIEKRLIKILYILFIYLNTIVYVNEEYI